MFPPSRFFPDITMNFTEHVFQGRPSQDIALYACQEGATSIQEVKWHELHSKVAVMANAMRTSGLKKGDRVAAVISNCVEAIVACLATISIGAIFSTSSPDMGVDGIMDRFNQIEPRFAVFESSVVYNGKPRPLMDKARQCVSALRKLSNFQEAIIINREGSLETKMPPRMTTWDEFGGRATSRRLLFEQVPFDHPGFIVYSSGTVS